MIECRIDPFGVTNYKLEFFCAFMVQKMKLTVTLDPGAVYGSGFCFNYKHYELVVIIDPSFFGF